jgi:hypothetical protein
MQQRIYVVTEKSSGTSRLIEAGLPAQALRHVANDLFDVKPANTYDVAKLIGSGGQIEKTKAE